MYVARHHAWHVACGWRRGGVMVMTMANGVYGSMTMAIAYGAGMARNVIGVSMCGS